LRHNHINNLSAKSGKLQFSLGPQKQNVIPTETRNFMPHIPVNPKLPGIIGLLAFRAETALPLSQLAETLLRGPSTLSSAERELIASHVSWLNDCYFCHSSHGAAAAAHLGVEVTLLDEIKNGLKQTTVSPKVRALLAIAGKVQQGGKKVMAADVAAARAEGATDLEIHDTVLIAAAFCMYNRYVDGLGTWAPQTAEAYREAGQQLASQGYIAVLRQLDGGDATAR
jgi:uncharacterized peroxidase-related enzyme